MTIIYHLLRVAVRFVGAARMAVAAANLFFDKDMRFYLPLPVGLAFKQSHSAAGN
jgi:hypothetical protein